MTEVDNTAALWCDWFWVLTAATEARRPAGWTPPGTQIILARKTKFSTDEFSKQPAFRRTASGKG